MMVKSIVKISLRFETQAYLELYSNAAENRCVFNLDLHTYTEYFSWSEAFCEFVPDMWSIEAECSFSISRSDSGNW